METNNGGIYKQKFKKMLFRKSEEPLMKLDLAYVNFFVNSQSV